MEPYSVLIADDDEQIRVLLSRICQELRWTVDLAEDGHQALQRAEEKCYPIYVLDVKMPGPSGLELAQRILEKNRVAAILILTGHADIEHAVRAIKQGVFDYIQKETLQNKNLISHLLRAAEFHENRVRQTQAQIEREKTLRDIETANKEFQSILELSGDLIFIVNARTGKLSDCNKAAFERLKYSREQILTLHLQEIIADLRETEWDEVVQLLKSQSTTIKERTFITQTKKEFSADTSCVYGCLESGEYLALIARDITERKIYENLLVDGEKRLQTILDSIQTGVIIIDPQSHSISDANPAALRSLGILKEEIVGKECKTLICPYKYDECPVTNQRRMFTNVEDTLTRSDGERIPIIKNVTTIQLSEKEFILYTFIDISELKKAEKAIRDREETLRQITSAAQDAIIMMDDSGNISFWNQSAERIFGYTTEETLGKNLHALLALEKYRPQFETGFLIFRETGTGAAVGQTVELMAKRKNGNIFPVEISLSAAKIQNTWQAIGIVRDISQRKKAEEELNEQRQKVETQATIQKTMIESMDEGIVLVDHDGLITEVNGWFLDLAQTPREFLLHQPADKMVQLITGCEISFILFEFASGQSTGKVNCYNDIADMRIMITLQPIYQDEEYKGAILNITDISDLISEQKKVEEEIQYNRDYLMTITKDLHTHVDGILDITSQLLNTPLDESQQLLLQMIEDFGTSISNLTRGCTLKDF